MTPEQFDELKNSVSKLEGHTVEIRKAIVGDPKMGHIGLAQRIDEQGKKISAIESYKTKIVAWAAGVSTAMGAGVAGVVSWLKNSGSN